MIKRLIEKVEKTANETLVTILFLIERDLDKLDKKQDKLEERMDEFESKQDKFERSFDSTKAEVDSNVDMKKSVKKYIVNAILGGFIAYIFWRLGMG